MFDLSDMAKRELFVLNHSRWQCLSTFAYASYLHVGRGAVLIDLTQPKTEYVIKAPPDQEPNFPPEMAAHIEAYDPSCEIVCALVFPHGPTVQASFNRYRTDTSSPEDNYHAAEMRLEQKNHTPKAIMDLAWLLLQISLRLN